MAGMDITATASDNLSSSVNNVDVLATVSTADLLSEQAKCSDCQSLVVSPRFSVRDDQNGMLF